MKLTVKTSVLQSMVARAMKGASCNKMIPITGLMCISLKSNRFSLTTTDATNYLCIVQDKVMGDDFEIVVEADMFSKLISRMTCDEVTMELQENSLHISGNGSYKIDLPLDEEGELIKYPDPKKPEPQYVACGFIHLSTVKLILATAKYALAKEVDAPCYTGYYCGDRVVATDSSVMCGIDITLFDRPALISAELMDLLDVFTAEKIEFGRDNNRIMFTSTDCILYGRLMDSIGDFQINVINSLLDQEYDSKCKISKTALMQLLDRLILFVGVYDRNSIDLTFTNNGLQISSKQANSVEIIPYSESYNFVPFASSVDIELFRSQVKACVGDYIELHYGLEKAIKFVDGNITQVIALLYDE